MVIMKALEPVFIDGRIVEAGSKFSCSSDFSKRLIEGKSAELVELQKVNEPDVDPERKKLESLTKDDLLKIIEKKGIEGIDESNKKAEIIDAILKADESDEL